MFFSGLPGGSPGPEAKVGSLGLAIVVVAAAIMSAALTAFLFHAARGIGPPP